jgi:hypothetical protein|tara:strand:+ start:227 stop:427 length:201 start_codon:yes stop_codon:yes gene_type:complete
MIIIEDANNERYHINPNNVVYVKQRVDPMKKEKWWKITFVNGEQLHTRNEDGVRSIINSIKVKVRG